ncbi:hypothetical protein SteCoe_22321 [Stentor coeruleus]|uniref:Arf-GAP domain-containing protein n=1 Tax=Stentor coeruleus TaxID=5963 RepID=A0A1R2BME9_9CILI|nr:hypothetical protein SteCoe_22321 [Stentor coeruleus]
MISRANIDQVFVRLQEDQENCICADCNCPSPVFASVSHGIFICSICVSSHSSLGSISETKSLLCNDWTLPQLKRMVSGGNSALKEFVLHYGICEMPIEIKYKTKALALYRKMLTEISMGRNFDEELLDVDEGRMSIDQEEEKNWFKGLCSRTKTIGGQALQHLDHFSEKTGIKSATEKIIKEMKIEEIKGKTSAAFDTFSTKLKQNFFKVSNKTTKLKQDTLSFLKNIEESIENSISKARTKISS